MFTDTNLQHICDMIEDQFPAFYKEQGPGLIAFIEAYYEWLEQPGNPLGDSRNRYKQFDVDTAASEFLTHYRAKYMWGLPPELLGNQRLLQKHILELYRTKGSQQAIRLLFRLLYNEDIEFYIPSYDIFKLSDNTWIQPNYLEVTFSPKFVDMVGNVITGVDSGATAIVENYESRHINGLVSYLLFVSNVSGVFKAGEKVKCGDMEMIDAPIIKGSVVGIQVTGSSPGMNIGELLTATIGDKPVKAIVSDTYDGTGSLRFVVEKPGTYYSLDATFKVKNGAHEDKLLPVVNQAISAPAYGFPKDPLADLDAKIGESIYNQESGDNIVDDLTPITGDGAEIRILSLKDTFIYQYNSDLVQDYLTTDLDGVYPFPLFPQSNLNTIVSDSLEFENITVGSIDQVLVINPGVNYTSNTWFQPIDPYTSGSGILDANGEFVGTNGLIVGVPIVGDNIVRSVKVHSSGYNNIDYAQISFTADANNDLTLTGLPIVGGLGWDVGYYDNTKSFLSDDKYLFDGHYYQDFSYVIRAARTLDQYIEILKMIAHPAGNAVYGDVTIRAGNQLYNKAIYAGVRKRTEYDGTTLNFLTGVYTTINKRGGEVIKEGTIQSLAPLTRASVGYRVDQNGDYRGLASNLIRYDYDPITLAPKGILLEGQATNTVWPSSGFGNIRWIKTNVTPVQNVGYIRNVYMQRLNATTTNGQHNIAQTVTFTQNTTVTSSFFVAAAELSRCAIACSDSIGFIGRAFFNLTTGTFTTDANVSATMVNHGSGLYRITATFTSRPSSTSSICQLDLLDNDGNLSFAGTGTSGLLVANAQFESGPFASSFVLTSNAIATRAADNFIVDLNTVIPYSPTEGSIVVEMLMPATVVASGLAYAFALSNSTAITNNIGYRRLPAEDQAMFMSPITSAPLPVTTTWQKVAFSWDSNGVRVSQNGQSVVATAGSFNIGELLTVLRLGSVTTSALYRPASLNIKKISVLAAAMDDTELVEASTW